MTRDEAIAALRECPACKTWHTAPACDRCWVNNHRCPGTVEGEVIARLEAAARLIEQTRTTLRRLP